MQRFDEPGFAILAMNAHLGEGNTTCIARNTGAHNCFFGWLDAIRLELVKVLSTSIMRETTDIKLCCAYFRMPRHQLYET